MIDLEAVNKSYSANGHREELPVLADIDLHIDEGRFVSLIGPSGCGKTTMLRIIAGLETPTRGRVLLDNKPIDGPSNQIGMVFQDFALFPWRTALDNIKVGLEVTGVAREKRHEMALDYVRHFGLAGFENHFPKELSGGMRQRVAIARTLIMNPRVVLMDEPFGSLDSLTRTAMQEFLLDVWRDRQETIIFVTHNVDEAVFLSDEIILFSHRPARIQKRYTVDTPRPRDITSSHCLEVRKEILSVIKEQIIRKHVHEISEVIP